MPSGERRPRLDGWGRFKVTFITFALYALGFPILLFHILLLIGCATNSPGMDNIYVASLSDGVRFSYTSLCAPTTTGRTCAPSVGKSPLILTTLYNFTTPAATLKYVIDVQTRISFVVPAMSALLFLSALLTLFSARGIIQRNGTNPPSHVFTITLLFWSSAAVAFAAAYSLTSSGAALAVHFPSSLSSSSNSSSENTEMNIEPGKVMLALQWITWIFSTVAAMMSGSITKTFLNGASSRRRRNSRSGSPYARRPSMRRANGSSVPPYSRDHVPRSGSPVSPI
ncbi:hypothetical protein BCIN_07g03100 [Botrytis cinerea B05.10]|uniref:Pali-domain-containing protein n=1 Tax=Botryotinia fuckeliana (strain B05.10) TaxID=332648 RepID=A0A384JML4_BOTFB|nr:hypothetical protein BCIN_07g03100 [Botrytis cinerea B05.10]ATZ51721.1 hypothetical protein BCIN_07g03100 [Botrytis cinerea B05.10]